MTNHCGFIHGSCPKGPKGHHKCSLKHKRAGGALHEAHECLYCKEAFT